MILYDDVCTPCVRKAEWRALRRFARKHNIPMERIDVRKQPQHADKAKSYEIQYPFVVHDGIALSLTEPLERLL